MSKVAIIYWSGTGNTAAMAEAVAEGAKNAGAAVSLMTSSEFDTAALSDYDAFAFGCPAMGAEALEEMEFEPMFTSIEDSLGNKKVALFGSYGWGDGEWMRSWEERCQYNSIDLVADSVMCNGAPDSEGLNNCQALGASLV